MGRGYEGEEAMREGERSLGSVYIMELSYIFSLGQGHAPLGAITPVVYLRDLWRKQGPYPDAKEDTRVLLPVLQDWHHVATSASPGLPTSPAREPLGESSPAPQTSQKGASNRTTEQRAQHRDGGCGRGHLALYGNQGPSTLPSPVSLRHGGWKMYPLNSFGVIISL